MSGSGGAYDVQRRVIGGLSVWAGTAGLFGPRTMARWLGVDERATREDRALPLLVRLVAARNIALGTAVLVRPVAQARRASEVTLLLTALDLAVVLVARRQRDAHRHSAVLSTVVFALAAAGAVQHHRAGA